jgi:hypothetical protein
MGCAEPAHQRNGFRCTDYIDYESMVDYAKVDAKAKELD